MLPIRDAVYVSTGRRVTAYVPWVFGDDTYEPELGSPFVEPGDPGYLSPVVVTPPSPGAGFSFDFSLPQNGSLLLLI